MRPSPTDKIYRVAGLATVVASLEDEGVNASDVLKGADLSPAQLRLPETRVSLHQMIQCYKNAVQFSLNPFFSYHAGLRFHVSTYGMYGFAMLSSTDFRQTVRFAEQYHQLGPTTASYKFKEESDYVHWTITPPPLPEVDTTLYRFIVELHFGIATSLHRDIMGSSFIPRELRMTYSSTADTKSLEEAFGCPVRFGCPENALVFDKQWLNGPATLGNETSYREVVKLCDQLMKEMQIKIGIAGVVREALLMNLAQPMSFNMVSRRLKISARTLKRRLREEGTSYQKVVRELRGQLAVKYVRDTELSIEEIASCLGYSEVSGFRHAFRRWTKTTPDEFRRSRERF
jgi:AraC-like DNA-binding protein